MAAGLVRQQLDDTPRVLPRLLGLVDLEQCEAETDVHAGGMRVEPEGLAGRGHGLAPVALLAPGVGEDVVGTRRPRVLPDPGARPSCCPLPQARRHPCPTPPA